MALLASKFVQTAIVLIALGVCSLHAEDAPVTTPLIEAAFADDLEKVRALIEGGAQPDQANRYGIAPLLLACKNGNAAMVKTLLIHDADPNVSGGGGESALMLAARTGLTKPVNLLIEYGAMIEARDKRGQDALMWAAAEGHAEVVSILLGAEAELTHKLKSGFTALHFAVRNGKLDVVAMLLEAGAPVDHEIRGKEKQRKAPPNGTTPLRLAVENGHFEVAVLLLENGADPNEQSSGHAPLHVLTWVRKPHRGDGDDGLPPPAITGSMTSLDFARRLVVDFGANVNLSLEQASGGKIDGSGATPFLAAAWRSDLPYLRLLHELGADPAVRNQNGTTPFLAASGVGSRAPEEEAGTEAERLEVLPWLLQIGADVNEVNRQGETAIHGAAYKNMPDVVAWLDEKGADMTLWNTKNKRRWTPLLIAQGFRPGNFKPSQETIAAIETVMKAHGVQPPPAPARTDPGKADY